ncbi:MAG: hypothetical protein ACK4M9_12165 [Anaerobacillus sp.]|uniref:hypothetical protein n=1 Tax=Anaerobacillus sp. TaxID=1872506 RepID=UPI00391C2F96
MRMRDLTEMLGLEKRIPVMYDSRLALKAIIQCQFCTPAEQRLSKDYDEDVFPSEEGVHIQNVSIEEFNEIMRNGNPPDFRKIRGMINDNINYPISMFDVIYAVFCLYHEEGHWIDFKSSGQSGSDFMRKDAPFRKPVYELGERIKKEEDPNLKLKLGNEWTLLYRNIPMEKYADIYALNKLSEIDWKEFEKMCSKIN